MKMYPTKYALSSGGKIRPVDVERAPYADADDKYVYSIGQYSTQYVVGRDIFATEGDALATADVARRNKIASLRKQIEKLEKLTFRVVEDPAP